jgi:hypothetical protein
MKNRIFIGFLIGFFGSFLAIALGYTDYYLIDISLSDALKPVWKWPVIGMSFILASLSISVPFVTHFFRKSESSEQGIVTYAFAYLWLLFFIFHPGLHALGVASDNAVPYAWFGVCVSQYLAARVVLKAIGVEAARSAA